MLMPTYLSVRWCSPASVSYVLVGFDKTLNLFRFIIVLLHVHWFVSRCRHLAQRLNFECDLTRPSVLSLHNATVCVWSRRYPQYAVKFLYDTVLGFFVLNWAYQSEIVSPAKVKIRVTGQTGNPACFSAHSYQRQ